VEIKYVYAALISELKARGDCGKDCLNCGLFRTHCPGCITRVCLVAKCKRGISYTGITNPKETCRFHEHCNSLAAIPDDKIQTMLKLRVKTKVRLPRFVPVIRLIDERSWFWDEIPPLPWIVVRLAELIKDKALMQKVSSRGLRFPGLRWQDTAVDGDGGRAP